MNFGTPQEMYEEDKDNNPSTLEENLFGCVLYILYVIIALIFKYFI